MCRAIKAFLLTLDGHFLYFLVSIVIQKRKKHNPEFRGDCNWIATEP